MVEYKAMEAVRSKAIILAVSTALLLGVVIPMHSAFADSSSTEEQVRAYFSDIPVMIAIAKCESNFRQFNDSGTVLHGGLGSMIGIFQIDEDTHTARALNLGYDINTIDGNMHYARYLYGEQGTEPWISSFPCWNSSLSTSTTTAISSSTPITLDLTLGMIDPQVMILQQILNKTAFPVASSGPGSPGNETTKFGSLTWAALKGFQCANGIACSGNEYSTGYGLVNARTRMALFSAATSTLTSAPTSTIPTGGIVQPPADDPAEIAQLKSQIAALLKIVVELQAQLALRH